MTTVCWIGNARKRKSNIGAFNNRIKAPAGLCWTISSHCALVIYFSVAFACSCIVQSLSAALLTNASFLCSIMFSLPNVWRMLSFVIEHHRSSRGERREQLAAIGSISHDPRYYSLRSIWQIDFSRFMKRIRRKTRTNAACVERRDKDAKYLDIKCRNARVRVLIKSKHEPSEKKTSSLSIVILL